jgi:peptidoglycan/xylan/chitin deacetylase (PgdA/CDA1 family)
MAVSALGATVLKAAAVLTPRFFFRRTMAAQRGARSFCVVSFDCDFPRDIEVLPALVELLSRYGIPASFACIGQWVRQFPDEHKLLVGEGFEVINHTETHPNLYHPSYGYARKEGLSRHFFNRLSKEQRLDEIERCHATFAEVLGVEATGFRTPHFGSLHVDDVYEMLAKLGYLFSSSILASNCGGAPYRTPEGIWEIPVSPCPLHPFGVFDSWHSLSKCGASHKAPGELSGLFATLIHTVAQDGGLANVYFDPKDVLESGELEQMLSILSESDIEVVDYRELVCNEQNRAAAFEPLSASY